MKMKARILRWTALLLLISLLAGCGAATTSPYQRPELNMPGAWQGAKADEAGKKDASAAAKSKNAEVLQGLSPESLATRALGFHDPELGRLLAAVMEHNNNLAAAAYTVRQARLTAGLKADALMPTASAEINGEYSKKLDKSGSEVSHSASGSLAYEVDLWGKLAKERDMATWEADATEEDLRATALSLIGTTAELYFNIAYLNESVALGQASIARGIKTLDLAQVRYGVGANNSLDVLQAKRDLAKLRANQEDLLRQLAVKRTALAVLLDGPPEGVVADPKNLPRGALPAVQEGLPAEVLGRRPDLRAAELRLRKALLNVDVKRVSYYPTFTLTGTLGSTSSALVEVVQNPVAALLAGVTLPFLQWNEMKLNIKLAKAEYEQSVVEFRQALYEALKEVEDALSSRQYYAAQGAKLAEALDSATKVERLYEDRYRLGADTMQNWLDAQESRQDTETSLLANRLNRLINYVTLYQALGGEPIKPTKQAESTKTITPSPGPVASNNLRNSAGY